MKKDIAYYKAAYEREREARRIAEENLHAKATELQRAEQQLHHLSNNLEQALEQRSAELTTFSPLPPELPNPFLRIAPDGTVAYLNNACRELWQPLLNLHIGQPCPPIFEPGLKSTQLHARPRTLELQIGQRHWSVQFAPSAESPGYVNIQSHNITAQYHAEAALRKSRIDLQEAQNLAGLGHWELDLDTSQLRWSSQLYDQYGLEPDGGIPTFEKIYKYVDPADLDFVKQELHNAVEHGYSRFEFKIRRPDGVVRHLQTTVKLDTNEKGQALRLYGTSLDITSLRSTQAQLEESEERFNLAVQGMHDGIWDWDRSRRTTYISPQYKEQLGYQDAELENTYRNLVNFVHPEDLLSIQEYINRPSPEFKSFFKLEIRQKHRSGHYRYFMLRAVVLRNLNGEVVRVVGSTTDINDQKSFERQQQKNLEQLQVLSQISFMFNQPLDNLDETLEQSIALVGEHMGVHHAYIFDTSLDGIFASTTFEWYAPELVTDTDAPPGPSYADFSGLEKALKRGPLIVNHPQELPSNLQHMVQDQHVHSLLVYPFQSNGTVTGYVGVDVRRQSRTWSGPDIEMLKTYGNLLSSVFERLGTENRVLQSEEKYRSLVENLSEVVFQTDLQYNLEYLNQAWEELTDIPTHEALGQQLTELMLPADVEEFYRFNTLLFNDQIDFSRQVARIHTPTGALRYVEIFAKPRTNPLGEVTGLTGTLTDVTEREMSQEYLIRAKEEAEAASNAKAQFLSVMSHEIRTPLNALLGIANLLIRQNPRFDQVENLRLLKLSGDNLLLLITDILDFNKIEAGKVKLARAPFNLQELSGNLARALKLQAESKGLRLNFTYDANLPQYVLGDATRLTQILSNLLDNAVKYTPAGQIWLEVQDEGRIGEINRVRFTVTDTGIGISPSEQKFIFKAFTQAEPATTQTYGGAGLGLTIVERLLELYGSHIEMKSQPGQGSKFSFVLPFETAEAPPETAAPVSSTSMPTAENPRLLLVEDNRLNTLVILQFLEGWGLTVSTAESGAEALQKLKNSRFDLVLMDLHMPGMDGFDTAQAIHATPELANLPIIALTANALAGTREKVLEAGMNDYLSKPFEPEVLFQKLKRYLSLHEYRYAAPADPAASVSDPPVYSLHNLLAESDGNEEFVGKMVKVFLQNANELVPLLEQGINEKKAESLKLAAHKLKPAATWLAITAAKPLIQTIEELPEPYTPEYLPPARQLLHVVRSCRVELTEWLQDQGKVVAFRPQAGGSA